MSDARKTANCRDFSRDSKAVFAVSTIYGEPVFGVSKQAIPKPARSATETSWNIKILLVARLDVIISNKRMKRL